MKTTTDLPVQGTQTPQFTEADKITGRSKIGSWFSGDKMFIAMHFIPLAAIYTGVTWKAVVLCIVSYWVRMFFVTAAYHRYFAHRSFETSRIFQFILAFGAETTGQKGVLWWSGHHRGHHKHSDTDLDIHSMKKLGFYESHIGWIFKKENKRVPIEDIQDFAKYPEIRFISKHDWIAPWTLGVVSFLIAGWPGLWIGFFLSTLITYHSTFTINSLTHKWGSKRYETGDESRNHWLLAITTMGEGWHNNHHYYQASARMGFYWWEIDMTYYILRFLGLFGLVWNFKEVPKAIKAKTIASQQANQSPAPREQVLAAGQ
ncbi:acyl-CoA desaturase [Turneriella parva]|uniref:Delta-9 acyl-phospholipid desaturase n=1 Tax=Turneriella parva (strain ATCC BAA-1111 / DSM 21527 / NCTC 11395 / H) TaxID=869212 RepID=I4B0Q0_TURPD|nr:acyl-CoA desaturase [Turneriella parva]AFM10857.1 Delta-9 acyl-phospholipid desaturase [Turneriella parva DSM 21527]